MRDLFERPLRRRLELVARLLACLALLGLAAWEGVQERYSTASHLSILVLIGVMIALALVEGRDRQRTPSRTWSRSILRAPQALLHPRVWSPATWGSMGWILLIAATIAWDLTSFTARLRSLPTLSRLCGDVTDHDWGRALFFAAWLTLGAYLALGWRRPSRRGEGRAASAEHSADPPRHPDAPRRPDLPRRPDAPRHAR
jgi:hypothetical protein